MRVDLSAFSEITIFNNPVYNDNRGQLTKFELPILGKNFDSILVSKNTLAGTVRGLHFQTPPFGEVKLVTCIRGKIIDYVLDIRVDSPNFGNWSQILLDDTNQQSILIPIGFAHGFQSLEPNTEVLYTVSGDFSPDHSITLNVNDPDIALDFPMAISSIADKDLMGISLFELRKMRISWK
jgi:dTDP-4-dehydrorhamnose 3,5-epimerase